MVRRIPGRGGEGEAYLRQLRRSAALARDRVVFRGPIFETAVLEGEFRAARIFAYPSMATRGETFGLAPLEAMTHGCAVLVSDLKCFHDFVSTNETGFVFEQGSSDPADSLVVLAGDRRCLGAWPPGRRHGPDRLFQRRVLCRAQAV